MENRPVVSIDVDGVLANFGHGAVKIMNEVLGLNLPLDYEPDNWAYADVVQSPGEWSQVWEAIKATKNFWIKLPAYKTNTLMLGMFLQEAKRDYDIYYVTSRPDTKGQSALVQTKIWLTERNLLKENCSVIVVRDPQEKEHMLRGIGAIASIDDYMPTAQKSARIAKHTSCLLDRPWNRDVDERQALLETGQAFIAFTFADFLNYLLRKTEERQKTQVTTVVVATDDPTVQSQAAPR